ncbi:hypothetical protein B0H17DRAFT_1074788, partial [Mycena rosella]
MIYSRGLCAVDVDPKRGNSTGTPSPRHTYLCWKPTTPRLTVIPIVFAASSPRDAHIRSGSTTE